MPRQIFHSPACKRALALTAALLALGQGVDYRQQIKIPPNEIFSGMLRFAEEKNFTALQTASQLLTPLYQVAKKDFGVDLAASLESGIGARDGPKTKQTVQQIIFYDLKALFALALAESERQRSLTYLKTAFFDYSLLAPEIQKANFTQDQLLRKLFQKSFYLAGSNNPFSGEQLTVQRKELEANLRQVEDLILKTLPQLNQAPATVSKSEGSELQGLVNK